MKIKHKFAWIPVFIRNRVPMLGFSNPHWVWLRRYTRIYYENGRTYNTVLGHFKNEVQDKELVVGPVCGEEGEPLAESRRDVMDTPAT